MGSTRPVQETILQRAKLSPEFRASLIGEALELIAENDVQTAKALIRDYVLAPMGFGTLVEEVGGTWRGMMIVLPADYWTEQFAQKTTGQMARFLRQAATHVRLAAFRKHPRGPKKKPPAKMNKKHRRHVSTARILQQHRSKTSQK